MKRQTRKITKRVLSLLLVIFLISINSFAAVVSDNDGSAFITKAEFDSLKSNFQSQIDQYNTSIDSKIDGAIASYLSGMSLTKTSNENFFDGQAAKVLVLKTDNINNLKRGYPGLQYSFLTATITRQNGRATNVARLSMERDIPTDATKCFEIFKVNSNKILEFYSNDYNVMLTVNSQILSISTPGAGGTVPTKLNVRWHGNQTVEGPSLAKERNDGAREYYSSRVGYKNYAVIWGAGWNGGFMVVDNGNINTIGGGSMARSFYTTGLSEKNDYEKIDLLFDTGVNENSIYFNNALDTKYFDADDITNYKNENIKFDLPSDNKIAPITTQLNGGIVANTNETALPDGNHIFTTSGEWTKIGGPGAGSETTAYSWNHWYEPAPMLSSLKPSEITNSGAQAQLSKYAKTGWTGKITQGIPIDMFKGDGTAEFMLDLSPFESETTGKLCVAFSTRPFEFSATHGLEDTTPSTGLTGLIMDSKTEAPSGVFVNVEKKIHRFKFNYSFGGDTPVFMHVGWTKDYTGTFRAPLTLPDKYLKEALD